MQIEKGRRLKLEEIVVGTRHFYAGIGCQGISADFACFGLDANGNLTDDSYMVFFNQSQSPCGGVALAAKTRDGAGFEMDLDKLPSTIDRLVLTAAIDGAGTMSQISAGYVRIEVNGQETARFAFSGKDFQSERALMMAEFYRKDGAWRFAATGQGFNGGLEALVKHFGGAVAEAAPRLPPPPPAPVSAPPLPNKISLAKITLEKRGDKVTLEKKGAQDYGRIRVNLNWHRGTEKKRGFLANLVGGDGGVDLDLGCMFEMMDGTLGVVQALGEAWGSFDYPPYIQLDSDDRTGTAAGGENVFINGARFNDLRRVLVYTFIYQGVPNWAATDGVVTLEAPGQSSVEVRLDCGDNKPMCAIAMLENRNGEMQVTKLVEYFAGSASQSHHEEMDRHFGFGLQWVRASKN